ncbi:endolysin [Gordonia phage Jumbo]|uniref:Endolysin n=1 Tax=Gordonia phage Jumbo TaxID=1887650 RepID=A0A1B3B0M0_9CAUD|nr:endolysin [Gordonia phage Jumbo]AOE44539.1 endolysin [Gordonia phage Jumbo]
MPTVIDSGSYVPPPAIRAAGHVGSFGYLSTSRPGASFSGKPITQNWVDDMKNNGLEIISCWQYGKDITADWRRGFNGGVADAQAADRRHKSLGGPEDAPIYFAVDNDIGQLDWRSSVRDYLRGINSVIGVERTGVYGHDECCRWAAQEGLIGRTHDDKTGKFYAWQTKAWSEGDIFSGTCVFQRIVDTQANPGPKINGSAVDVNDILSPDYGQWSFPRGNWDFILTQMMGTRD